MVKALIHRYDNKPDMLAVEKNRCSDVFNHSLDNDFELVIVVPTRAANTDLAVIAEALSGQYQPAEPRSWPGKPAAYVWRVDVGLVKETTLTIIKEAFDEANLNWAGAWTIRNVSLPDWIRDLLDDNVSDETESLSVAEEGLAAYRTGKSVVEEEVPEEVSAMEGLLREQTSYTRTRDRRLRNQALNRSKGVCEACEVDFSKLLNGQGVRALQVHHRNQLALSDLSVITKLSDLAVVCANCHALIHMNRDKAIPVEELKQLLGNGQVTKNAVK
ncbi:hypothetical protein CLV58_12286 [Spirosoma oryzae]|uniref:HNH endonuclease n=1 Tax=Spirosoma oryzae TaxID=1469603 RepID=A0A2T0SED6_9BACT|nr:hypothetical protein [Spirosoma oryzae]PRY31789.1 hypothetical protein CLV58_12286 [Spirosoma oryzae]